MTPEIFLWSGFEDLRPRPVPGIQTPSIRALQDGGPSWASGPQGWGKQAPEETLRGTPGKQIRPPSFPGSPDPL